MVYLSNNYRIANITRLKFLDVLSRV